MSSTIYLDNAATTPVRKEVLEAMLPYFREEYGNASSVYSLGRNSKKALEASRETIAACFGAKPEEIFFTSCGSESDNWALRGVAFANQNKGKHIITSSIEHHAILHTCAYLEKLGFEVTYLPVDKYGRVSLEDVKNAVREDTILISVMMANHEIGTIQPIKEIGAFAKEKGIIFHTDAVQAAGHIKIDVNDMNIDLMSVSGHKLGAQKGIGLMYIRKGTKIGNFMFGGAQEKNRRAGTENIPAIVGFAKAVEIACGSVEEENARLTALRDKLIDGLLKEIPYSRLNGHRTERLPGNCNISFEFIEGESILMLLDMKGICASSGSACTSGSLDPSHVLLATGLKHEEAHGSIRFSLGYQNTEADVDAVLKELPPIVERLRGMSPLYDDFMKNKGDK